MYIAYIQYFENLIRILLDLFIINKIKNFVFFYSKNYCMQSSSTKFFILLMNKSNKIKSMGSDPMRDSFLALRDSCGDSGRDWFPILFFSAQVPASEDCQNKIKCHIDLKFMKHYKTGDCYIFRNAITFTNAPSSIGKVFDFSLYLLIWFMSLSFQ